MSSGDDAWPGQPSPPTVPTRRSWGCLAPVLPDWRLIPWFRTGKPISGECITEFDSRADARRKRALVILADTVSSRPPHNLRGPKHPQSLTEAVSRYAAAWQAVACPCSRDAGIECAAADTSAERLRRQQIRPARRACRSQCSLAAASLKRPRLEYPAKRRQRRDGGCHSGEIEIKAWKSD